jgi:hypothetical protein
MSSVQFFVLLYSVDDFYGNYLVVVQHEFYVEMIYYRVRHKSVNTP